VQIPSVIFPVSRMWKGVLSIVRLERLSLGLRAVVLYACTLALQGTVTEMDKNNPNEMIVGV